MTRLLLAVTSCTAIPILVALAYLKWKRTVRRELLPWRNGAGLAAIVIVFALWLIQTAHWGAMALHGKFAGFLGTNLTEAEWLLPAFYAYAALLLAFALKGIPRLQIIAAWLLLAVFYGTFGYT